MVLNLVKQSELLMEVLCDPCKETVMVIMMDDMKAHQKVIDFDTIMLLKMVKQSDLLIEVLWNPYEEHVMVIMMDNTSVLQKVID